MHKLKRIGIDARFYGPIGKGLGRYIQEIVDNVVKIDPPAGGENKYVIFLGRENFDEFVCDNKNVKKVLADAKWYSLTEQIKMPFLIWREHLDLMHFPHFNVPVFCPVKFVVTIHDLILTKFPTQRATTLAPVFYKIKNLAYKAVIWLAVHRARRVIAVSEFTKNDIADQFKINNQPAGKEKIIVTYEGVANLAKGRDSLFTAKLDDKKTLLGYNINSPFLLYVGNAYPHKNLEGLVRVFEVLARENEKLRLVLVGKEDYFYERVKNYAREKELFSEDENNSKIIFPGYVPDAQLEILFKRAIAYIFPSFYEGFGLPPLEAMAKGCPVVSSDKASMPEILGDAAIYFNPEDEGEMLSQIKKIINPPAGGQDLRDELVNKGYEQVKKYNWWECANKTLNVYKNIIHAKKRR